MAIFNSYVDITRGIHPSQRRRAAGFKLAEGTAVTFRLYVDNLGAGALDVSMA